MDACLCSIYMATTANEHLYSIYKATVIDADIYSIYKAYDDGRVFIQYLQLQLRRSRQLYTVFTSYGD
eukprot:11963-Heterococcus_DN1.PRE.3